MVQKFKHALILGLLVHGCIFLLQSGAQTTDGRMTGVITDPSGASISGAQVEVQNDVTGQLRPVTTDSKGTYEVSHLPPGRYTVTVTKAGFATEQRKDIQLVVNQSVPFDFVLGIASNTQVVEVTGAAPQLNTTDATLGDVIGHEEAVGLPLNGREFTQLTLLTPGAAPIEQSQQGTFTVALGSGGISPAVNGQSGYDNNFTMDGVLNNLLFQNTWMISPPPDALQEFNVQSHITDAQYGISSGANINVATRSGTNSFHGAGWEFARNATLDAKDYFATKKLPYTQNQYGVFLSGPILKHNTWFAGYWEGYRSSQTLSYTAGVPTQAMRDGDFSAVLGKQTGMDSLGRPIYQNEIYDPLTSRPDPANPGVIIRDPFPGNIIPASRINFTAPIILKKYYPLPNVAGAAPGFGDLIFAGDNSTKSDVFGIRSDHQFSNGDSLFGRYNRSNSNKFTPEQTPGYSHFIQNFGESVAVGYTHMFGSKTILDLRYAWANMDTVYTDELAGTAFTNSINFTLTGEGTGVGPAISITNGYSGIGQFLLPLGPQKTNEIHADISRSTGDHTITVGGMFFRVHSFGGGNAVFPGFTQNATSLDGSATATGYGPASFLLGLPDNLGGYVGKGLEMYSDNNWYTAYAQDQWKANTKLTLTLGLRYDYVTPPALSHAVSGLDLRTGIFNVTGPVLPLYPKATGRSTYYYPQYNGFQPRFGLAYRAAPKTVFRSGIGMFDDHNHALVQENGNLRVSWPYGVSLGAGQLNRGLPDTYFDKLPDASTFLNLNHPYVGSSSDPHNKIPYTYEFNLGIEQQLLGATALKVNYVGSLGRHQALLINGNTPTVPGPGSYASRGQPFPQYGGGTLNYEFNGGSTSYNGLQALLERAYSSGLSYKFSYTWSKSLDFGSDTYGADGPQNIYDLSADWGISNFNLKHMFVFSGVYVLPVGKGKMFLNNSNKFSQAVLGNWNVGTIVSLRSGNPFSCAAGDVANTASTQRCNRIGDPYSASGFHQTRTTWLTKNAFNTVQYTYGTERRGDLTSPSSQSWDFNVFKEFPIRERVKLEFRGEFFNLLNHTNFGQPDNNYFSGSFGQIFSAASARQIQLAGKISF